jgi:putative photosynthetic complex assembly protein
MTDAVEKDMPRGPLIAAAGLVVISLLAVGLARLNGFEPVRAVAAPVVESHDLHFVDRPSGAVDVLEGGKQVAVLPSGYEGFVRVVLRSFTRDRKLRGLGREEPFRIRRHADGRLSIEDRATFRTVDLAGFGADNIAAFAKLIEDPKATP